MSGSHQRCDCELDLDQAKKGDLPSLCVGCGERAQRFVAVELGSGSENVTLRLPLCPRHQNQRRWLGRSWMLLVIGALMVAVNFLGKILVFVLDLQGMGRLLNIPVTLSLVFAIFLFFGALFVYWGLRSESVRIRRLSPTQVTLAWVAPEFAEAYRRRRARQADSRLLFSVSPEEVRSVIPSGDVPLSDEAVEAIQTAARDAILWGDDHIGTRHLLTGLRLRDTDTAHALQTLGINFEQICESRQKAPLESARSARDQLPYTPALRRAVASAAAEAKERGHGSVRAAHLLLGILREPDNDAVQLLIELGISPEEAARRSAEAIRLLESVMVQPVAMSPHAIVPKGQDR